MGGGDLLNLLIERDVFDEDFTRFYVAEVRRIPCSFFTRVFVLSTNLLTDDSCHRVMS